MVKGPVRSCVICRQKFNKKELTRFVALKNGVLVCDELKVLPGRGWYCCSNPQCAARMSKYWPGGSRKNGK